MTSSENELNEINYQDNKVNHKWFAESCRAFYTVLSKGFDFRLQPRFRAYNHSQGTNV